MHTKPFKGPLDYTDALTMHVSKHSQRHTHTHSPNRLCVRRVSTVTWAQRGWWEVNIRSQGIVLGPVSPESPGGSSLTLDMCVCLHVCVCVCVWLGSVSSMLSWHCLQWKAAFQFNYEKKRQRGGRWGSMLMLLCEGTLTAKQLGERNYSSRSESRRMGQEKGGCVRKTHTNAH